MTVQWKLVPTKANKDMAQAGGDAAQKYLEDTGFNSAFVIYEAMVAVAPPLPALPVEPEKVNVQMLKGGTWRLEASPDGQLIRLEDHNAYVAKLQADFHDNDLGMVVLLSQQHDYDRQLDDLQVEICKMREAALYFYDHAVGNKIEEPCGTWGQYETLVITRPIETVTKST